MKQIRKATQVIKKQTFSNVLLTSFIHKYTLKCHEIWIFKWKQQIVGVINIYFEQISSSLIDLLRKNVIFG